MTQVYKQLPATPKQALKRIGGIDEHLSAELFKALGDPTRLLLFSCLAKCGRACSVTEVSECCDIDFSVVSRHLALLARAGVVDVSKEGRTVYYQVRYKDLSHTLRKLAQALEGCCGSQNKKGSACGCK